MIGTGTFGTMGSVGTIGSASFTTLPGSAYSSYTSPTNSYTTAPIVRAAPSRVQQQYPVTTARPAMTVAPVTTARPVTTAAPITTATSVMTASRPVLAAAPVTIAAPATVTTEPTVVEQVTETTAQKEAELIDGKEISAMVRADVKAAAEKLVLEHGVKPGLAVILVGERKDSQSYVKNKKKMAAEVDFHTVDVDLPDTVSQEDLLKEVEKLNNDL